MKKSIAFLLVLIMITFMNASLADIRDFNVSNIPTFETYKGIWFGNATNDNGFTLTIGKKTIDDSSYRYVAVLTNMNRMDDCSYTRIFYLTYDKELDIIYLTEDETAVSYKMKLNGEKLELYGLVSGTLIVSFDKLH